MSRHHVCLKSVACLVLLFTLLVPRWAPAQRPPPPCQSGCYAVRATPKGSAYNASPNSTANDAAFDVQNTGTNTGTFHFACAATGGVTCDSVRPTSKTLTSQNDWPVDVWFHAGVTNGTVTLRVTGSAIDTGYYNVILPAKPRVALRNANGDTRDYSQCLTSGAGEAAAWQCGDLLVTHALPGYVTMGRERALTLMYNSAAAVPVLSVAAAVTEGGTSATPDSVGAWLSLGTPPTKRDSAIYTTWAGTRQIVLKFLDSTDASGVYPFTLLVRNYYHSPSGTYDSTVTGNIIFVERRASSSGMGWFVAGREQLFFNQPNGSILWTSGVEAARLFAPAGANIWVAPLGGFRDTITYNSSTQKYTRTLRHGVTVTYDATGTHIATTNRVGQSTTFYSSSHGVDSIAVPPAGQSGTMYRFSYDGNAKIAGIAMPDGRALTTHVANGLLTSIRDPDGDSTAFTYDAAGRMTGRRNRAGTTTAYQYDSAGLHVNTVRVPLDVTHGDTATTTFRAWDEQGLHVGTGQQTAVDTAVAYTKIDGPRTEVLDTAEFWVDRWGAPVKMRDPVGNQTIITRGDASHPALVTRQEFADGRILNAFYNSRGNLDSLTDSTFQGVLGTSATQRVTTRYVYGTAVPDSPTEIRGPVDTTRVAYDSSLGLPTLYTAQGGHKTAFLYITSGTYRGLLASVTDSAISVVDTTATGWTKSPLNLVTQFEYDVWGNDTLSTSPKGLVTRRSRDASRRVRSVYDPAGDRTDYGYDVLNRTDTVSVYESVGPLRTRYYYNTMGVIDSVVDPRGVKRSWQYDAAARPIHMTDDLGHSDSSKYNRAGLIDTLYTRKGHFVYYSYDAAGRLTRLFHLGAAPAPADSILRTYDAVGRLLTVTNATATDSLTYNREGSVRSERQIVRLSGSPILDFTMRTWYDVGSRRVKFFNGTDTLFYQYGADARLAQLKVQWLNGGAPDGAFPADSFAFSWDGLGRRDSVRYYTTDSATNVIYGYDRDGNMRMVCSKHPGGQSPIDSLEQRWRYTELTADALVKNEIGYVGVFQGSNCSATGSLIARQVKSASYDARHQLLSDTTETGQGEFFAYDSSGNMISSNQGALSRTYAITAGTNQLVNMYQGSAVTHYSYDLNGSRIEDLPGSPVIVGTKEYWYNALSQMIGDSTYDYNGQILQWIVTRNCGYDGFGRRVLGCGTGAHGFDGDNVIRLGTVWRYVHGPGVDDPLVAVNYEGGGNYSRYYYLTDGQGKMLAFTDSTGYSSGTTRLAYSQNGGNQAGAIDRAQTFTNSRGESSQAPHLSFYRNRYYDQQTGRWTQEDPIGLAGGVNLYAYAGNNPLVYTDPFGLRVDFKDAESEALWRQLQTLARNAGRSRNKKIAAAGVALGNTLSAIEASDKTVTVSFRQGSAWERFNSRETGTFELSSGNARIRIDPTFTSGRYGVSNEMILLHEMGHAFSVMSGNRPGGAASWGLSVDVENLGRTILGCEYRPDHTTTPACP